MTHALLSWGTIETRFATFAAWVDDDGRLVRFHLNAVGAADVDRNAIRDECAIADVRRQVEEYCAGERWTFDVERAARGTAFQHAVWEALMAIPYGETRSYGEIARAIGAPHAARGVGAANAANPIALIVPCHRVIGADGGLTGYGGGLPAARARSRAPTCEPAPRRALLTVPNDRGDSRATDVAPARVRPLGLDMRPTVQMVWLARTSRYG